MHYNCNIIVFPQTILHNHKQCVLNETRFTKREHLLNHAISILHYRNKFYFVLNVIIII